MLFELIKKKKVIYILVGLFILISCFVAFRLLKKSSAASSAGRDRMAVPVLTVKVELGDLSSINTLTGLVAANLQTDVGSKLSGRVQIVSVVMGQKVSKGQLLAKLDPIDLQKQLDQIKAQIQIDEAQIQVAQNNYGQSSAEFGRNQTLYNNNAISKDQFEQAQLQLGNYQSQLEVTQATLRKDTANAAITEQQIAETDIVSPVDGTIATRNIEVGEQVSSQTTLFDIAQLDPLKVTVNLSDQLIASISYGTAANITVPELGTTVFQGNVDKISPVLDSVSHAYPVEITIGNPQNTLLPGMTASVKFLSLKTIPGILIPAEAVVETAQGSEVFTVNQNVAHMHLVQLGAVSNDKILVSTGLQPGDEVIIKGQTLLADNTPVTVVINSDQAGVQGMINQVKPGAQQ